MERDAREGAGRLRRWAIHLGGDGAQRAASLCAIPFLTRALGPDGYGALTSCTAAAALATILFAGGLPAAVTRDVAMSRVAAGAAVSAAMACIAATSLACMALAFPFRGLLDGNLPVVLAVGLLGGCAQVAQSALLASGRDGLYRLAGIGSGLLGAAAVLACAWSGLGIAWCILAMGIGFALPAAMALAVCDGSAPGWGWLPQAYRYGLPLVLYAAGGGWLVELSGRVTAGWFVDGAELGRYGLAAQIASIYAAVAAALNTAELSRYLASGTHPGRLPSQVVGMLALAVLCAAPWAVGVLGGGRFAGADVYLPGLLAALAVGGPVWYRVGNPLFRDGRTHVLAAAAGAGCVATLAVLPLGLLLGAHGCVLAQAAGTLAMAAVAYGRLPSTDRPRLGEFRWIFIGIAIGSAAWWLVRAAPLAGLGLGASAAAACAVWTVVQLRRER